MANELYKSKKKRWQRKRATLHPDLRDAISDRNISSAEKLPLRDQQTLAAALSMGLERRQPTVITFLKARPGATVEQVLSACRGLHTQRADTHRKDKSDAVGWVPSYRDGGENAADAYRPGTHPRSSNPDDMDEMVDHLLASGAASNKPEAEGVAQSVYMAGALGLVMAKRRIWDAENSNTSQVTVAVCEILLDLFGELTELLEEKYHHRMVLLQSKVDWEWLSTGDSDAVPKKTDVDTLSAWMFQIGRPAAGLTAGVAMDEGNALLLDLTAVYRRLMAHDENPETEQATYSTFGRVGFALQVMRDVIDLLVRDGHSREMMLAANYDYPDWFGPIWEEVTRIAEIQKEHDAEQDLLNGTSRADDIFYPHPRPPEDPNLPF